MPFDQVMHKFKQGNLHSGSKAGPPVKNRKQAIAIMLSEKRNVGSHPEYAGIHDAGPSKNLRKKKNV